MSAALEFAVTKLGVEEIVVLGHGACGGVNAALTQSLADSAPGEGGFVAGWISLLPTMPGAIFCACSAKPAGKNRPRVVNGENAPVLEPPRMPPPM